MSEDWSKRLNGCFNAGRGDADRRSVRLPAHPGLRFSGAGDVVQMHLSGAAVSGNMQTNAAAFESWALALHRWCGVGVTITWDEPVQTLESKASDSARGHYQRFLYRLANFAELFSDDWLTVVDEKNALLSRLTARGKPLYVNRGGSAEKKEPKGVLPHEKWSEDRWECHLASDKVTWLDDRFRIHNKTQQFPVGLFNEPIPSNGSRVFPGAKSAIDIIAQTPSDIWIFELKKSGNIGFGALSELLFYTWFVRDLADGHFKQAATAGKSRVKFQIEVEPNKAIHGVLLAEKVHPLIEDCLRLPTAAAGRRSGRKIDFRFEDFDPGLWSQASQP